MSHGSRKNKKTDPRSEFEIEAGDHIFFYEFLDELRFGPPFYRIRTEGPEAEKLNKFLHGREIFFSGPPLNTKKNWMVFEVADGNQRLRRRITVFDLKNGRELNALKGDSLDFEFWRPGSEEFIFLSWADFTWSAFHPPSGKRRELFRFSNMGFLSGDGRSLLLIETGTCKVVLVDVEKGGVVAKLGKKDFRPFAEKPVTITPVRFDPNSATLALLINYRQSLKGRRYVVEYDAAVRIEFQSG